MQTRGKTSRGWLPGNRCCRSGAAALLLAASGLVHGDATPTDPERRIVAPDTSLQSKVEFALHDAARRNQIDAAQLHVTLAEAVTWPDGALGCPQPGREYSQRLVDGYRIRILADTRTLEYHASLRGQPFLCPAERIQGPALVDPRR
jgi:hypothetical protein